MKFQDENVLMLNFPAPAGVAFTGGAIRYTFFLL